ncbi:DHA1 family bicyclomycin/chloramphenicol resistance-like MFS transporter [Sphaerotilus hippei]|uniref:Bcr/CflA family efflux transporter n=1 Tax=Sphaerotilus hippei TaxID=744406 RepID=A0A318H5Y5_9BURK|nr:multidrug effflux MFS transporter [Sphaerotilus hippei]PXW96930.1 DHA1 family bicyclomycin/chloramphenicol resistance-like MFS transporter [Sphaerotilus hippei]
MSLPSDSVWKAPRWALAVLLATLSMLGPFSIDTYLPAFAGIAGSLQASPLEMQQTLSAYLLGFAVMNLFHGALADSFGRRPVVLTGLVVFTLASLGCALSTHVGTLVLFRALQGMSTGAGVVVSRAVIRDLFPPAEAQRMMSQVTIYFGVAPAIAPILGGWLYVHLGWHAIFGFLALVGVAMTLAVWRVLPETLPASQRQSFDPRHLMLGYSQLGLSGRFWLLALASGVPFNGMFLYVLSAPTFLGELLGLGPTEFFWFFLCNIGGIMLGAWTSGRMAGRLHPRRQIRIGFGIMTVASALNLGMNLVWPPTLPWALLPLALYAYGWALLVPVVTLMVLDLFPARRGMSSSLQATVASTANAMVAGLLAPLVMHSAVGLALASSALMAVGLLAWLLVKRRMPREHERTAP